jgi:CBS domain-containing protein
MDLDDAARILFRYGLRNIPVIDDNGIVIGILSNVDVVRSHIERATPNKVLMVKTFLEKKNGISITVKRRIIPIEELRPTQSEVFADELIGRMEEIKRGLVEPIIVVQKSDHYLLVDGHHRVLAARQMGVKQFSAVVLEPDRDIELGMERSAKEMGLKTMEDVKVIDKSHPPLMEIIEERKRNWEGSSELAYRFQDDLLLGSRDHPYGLDHRVRVQADGVDAAPHQELGEFRVDRGSLAADTDGLSILVRHIDERLDRPLDGLVALVEIPHLA